MTPGARFLMKYVKYSLRNEEFQQIGVVQGPRVVNLAGSSGSDGRSDPQRRESDIKADPDVSGVYLPLLNKLDLALLEVCRNVNKLAESLVREWLKNYLLKLLEIFSPRRKFSSLRGQEFRIKKR